MWPNPQFTADLDTFTEKILNGKHHVLCSVNCVKYRNYAEFPGVETLCKCTASAEFRANENCSFPQNIHTRKLDEIKVFWCSVCKCSVFKIMIELRMLIYLVLWNLTTLFALNQAIKNCFRVIEKDNGWTPWYHFLVFFINLLP